MSKFKIGDVVRCLVSRGNPEGWAANVIKTTGDNPLVLIKLHETGRETFYWEDELELDKNTIVTNILNDL